MPLDVELSLRITVNTEEEAEKIKEAEYSGLAGELVKLGVLYGQIPVSGVIYVPMTPPVARLDEVRQETKKRDAIELKRVEDKAVQKVAPSPTTSTSETEQKQEAPRGKRPLTLIGRPRLERGR